MTVTVENAALPSPVRLPADTRITFQNCTVGRAPGRAEASAQRVFRQYADVFQRLAGS